MFVRYFKYIFGADGTDIAAENFDKGGSGELVVRAFNCMCQSCIQPWHWPSPSFRPGAAECSHHESARFILHVLASGPLCIVHGGQGSTHAKINQCIIGYCGITNLSKVADLCGLHIAQVINMVAPSPSVAKIVACTSSPTKRTVAVSVACQVCSLCGVEQPRVSCSDVREWRDAGVERMQGANQPVIAT